MGNSFLRKLFGASQPVPREVQAALDRLTRVTQERPELTVPVSVLRDVLPRLFSEPVREAKRPPTMEDHQREKLRGAVPLLRGETLSLDVPSFRRRWFGICAVLRQRQMSDTALSLVQLMRRGQLHPQEMLEQVLAGRPEEVHGRVAELGGDAGLAGTVLRLSLFPVLAQVSQDLAPLLKNTPWQQGFCPVCGSWPLLGEFRGLEQTRFLRCGLCSTGWEFPRLRCPFCGNTDHHTLGYFHVEGEEERCRAATCDSCRGYVKMIATLQALVGPELLAADVATMHLDLALAERGYFAG